MKASFRLVAALSLACLSSACGHTPVTRTLADAFVRGADVKETKLDPKLRYLRVVAGGRESLMVLGYADAHPDGVIESWYSSAGEVIRLQNGRVISTSGLSVDWRSVRYTGLPDWTKLLDKAPVEYVRERDEMPGYRFGIREKVSLFAVRPPDNARLVGLVPSQLHWFEESADSSPGGRPSARYGVRMAGGPASVVYGEQCLAAGLCIAWQTWPVNP